MVQRHPACVAALHGDSLFSWIAAIDLLGDVVAASGKTPVLFDSGVRSGSDVVKALALGAAAVGIGRPYAYGLALDVHDGRSDGPPSHTAPAISE